MAHSHNDEMRTWNQWDETHNPFPLPNPELPMETAEGERHSFRRRMILFQLSRIVRTETRRDGEEHLCLSSGRVQNRTGAREMGQ